jgi:site-specific recombinase XerD
MMSSDEENLDWVRSFKSGDKWFKKLGVRKSGSLATKRYYARSLREFSEYMKMSPDQIMGDFKRGVASDLEATLERWSDNLEFFVHYLTNKEERKKKKLKPLKKSSAAIFHAAIKSFFKYNSMVELKAPTPQYYSERIPPVTLEDLRALDKACNVQQRFFLRFLKDSGMPREDAVNVDYGHIRREFEKGHGFIHIDAFRSKENVEYDAWLGPNTVYSLKTYLNVRRQRGEQITDDTPLFATWNQPFHRIDPRGLSAVFKRLSEKTGITVRPHKIRKFFETYLALAKIHYVILKYWMGHKVATGKKDVEMRYIIPPVKDQRKLYMEAYKQIDLLHEEVSEEERRIRGLVDNARLLGIPEGQIEMLLKERGKTWRNPEELALRMSAFRRQPKPAENVDCPNGKSCPTFKEVNENELLSHLKDGWRIIHNLKNGKVIIQRG